MRKLQWDLGGLAYEMAIRDHFRGDVLLARVAAGLHPVDVGLAEIERLLHLDEEGAGEACPARGALRVRATCFCRRHGTPLLASSSFGAVAVRVFEGAEPGPQPFGSS